MHVNAAKSAFTNIVASRIQNAGYICERRVAANMDNEASNSRPFSSLLNPSRAVASWYAGLGVFGLFIGLLNMVGLSHPNPDIKISWAGYLTVGQLGEGYVYNTGFHPVSDTVFFIITGVIAAIGLKTIAASDGGIGGWFSSMFGEEVWGALVSSEEGTNRSLGAWLMFLGIIFYISWGVLYSGWVDVGVYSVSAALFFLGYGMKGAADVKDAEVPLE